MYEHEDISINLKKIRSQSITKEVPSHDHDPSKHALFQSQELGKKKDEIEKLNKEISKLIE